MFRSANANRLMASGSRPMRTAIALTGVLALAACFFATAALASRPAGDVGGSLGVTADQAGLRGLPPGAKTPIWETASGRFHPEPAGGPALIRLAAGFELDPSVEGWEGEIPSDLRSTPPIGAERGYFIVQFRGPVTQEDRALIESQGGAIVNYVPDYAFLCSLSGDAKARLARESRVSWVGLYEPAYKLSRDSRMSERGPAQMTLLVYPGESLDAAAEAVSAAGGRILETTDSGVNKMIRAEIDTARLASIAQIREIAWIEPYTRPVWDNDLCQWVIQTNINGNRRIWTQGIQGQGQIVSLADSGIRTTHYQFYDAAVPLTNFGNYPTHRKIIAYQKAIETPEIVFGDDAGNQYHGTHTSCTDAGDDSPNGTSARDGMALKAKIYFLDAGGPSQPGVFVPTDLNLSLITPYNGNSAGAARVMSNSWGNPVGGAYDAQAMSLDQFIYNHPDFLEVHSCGNNGPGGNTVGSPASAKNCMTAGGSMNGTSANTIYTSSSRGPTDDGRIKPTILAPARLASALGSGDTSYATYEGTSMSAPAAAGASVLARQYLTDGWYPTGAPVPGNAIASPSAALLKAIAVNSGSNDITGFTSPDNNVGWGRMNLDETLYFTGDARGLAVVENTRGLLTGEFVEYQVYVANNAIPLKAAVVWTDYPGSPSYSVQLVNDLNLTATDGVNTYLGNVYSGGQSATGGTADARNVEECVRRNSPTLGVWTFRIEGLNVPYGPQKFAFVVTGGLGSDQGIVTLDEPVYTGTDNMLIRVVDTNAGASVSVTATSTTESSTETVVLPGAGGVYQGSLPLTLAMAASGDGRLSVTEGDEIVVTYNDANPVTTLTATAIVDLTGPTITNVRATAITESDATINWTSSTVGDSKVYYGPTPALGLETGVDPNMVSSHAVALSGLLPGTLYYYDVETADGAGNAVRDDNGGMHYTFTADRNRDVLLVIGDSTFDKKVRYTNAFARIGWTYTIWEGASAATPYVGDLVSGMASFKAVVWQTGLEQYPMLTDAARDSVARLNDLGSRFAIFSHDVAWDFCDPTSPDYTVARCDWFKNELHSVWQSDPASFSQVRGIASDPISGGYTAGVSYTPHRSGAAGDEIDGLAIGGSFAYVWRDNDTSVDDIALRFTTSGPVGDPLHAVWGGTPEKISSNFFEWAHLNNTQADDAVRADILDKTLTWLVGRDNPIVDLTAPAGGEVFTDNSISISWTESAGAGYSIAARRLYYSDNSGESWTLITAAPGTSPYTWDISSVPNGIQYRVRVVIEDNGAPVLSAAEACASNFTINRAGGDTRGPLMVGGSMFISPNPVLKVSPYQTTLTGTTSDVSMGNSNIVAIEWSNGPTAAPPGGAGAHLLTAPGVSPVATLSTVIDNRVLAAGNETIWMRGKDAAGNWGPASPLAVVVNANPSSAEEIIPTRFALHVNAPNPFNPVTTIRYDLPKSSAVNLSIYDVTGRRVRTLVEGTLTPGSRSATWDGRDAGGNEATSGVYFYRIEAGDWNDTKKMTLLK